jgi:hypothetical protein
MKRTVLVVAVFVMGATLSACGDDGDSGGSSAGDYCDQLKDAQDEVEGVDFTTLDDQKYDDLVGQFNDLEDAAPEEVKDDWTTLNGALTDFKGLLDDAGISLDDLSGLQSGQVPDGVDVSKLQELGTKMQELTDNGDFEDASDAITQHAKDECGIDLDEDTTTDSGS